MADRLSALPDEVIFHLLSFLPLKMFVQTSILSKGWRDHWKHVPRFVATTNITDQAQVMSQNISNTCFPVGSGTSNQEFESWIATVFARDPRNLVIDLDYQLALPPCLFTCKTLLYLYIHNCGEIPCYGDVYFPALKKLELINVGYPSSYSLEHLLLGCPVLEELTIDGMKGYCPVQSETVTKLVINIECYEVVALLLPSLRYLCFHGSMWGVSSYIGASDLPFLIEADIDLTNEFECCLSDRVIQFVLELYNVRRLTLSTHPIYIGTSSFFLKLDGIKFHNLTELNLRADWRFITCFLQSANNLRVLTILSMVDVDHCVSLDQYWMEPKQVPACLESHLKRVSIVDFGWCKEHEFDMVKYVLKNAKVLKMMEIKCTQNYQLDSNVKREAIERFARFEIESKTCELLLTLDAATEI